MNFFDGLMTPLNRGHCMYFYVLGWGSFGISIFSNNCSTNRHI